VTRILQDSGHFYVYWNWTGYGWSLRQRATVNSYTEISLISRDLARTCCAERVTKGNSTATRVDLGVIKTKVLNTRRTKSKILVTSMCIGTGQGMAGLFVNEQL
jgi:hypothetical protein